MDYAYRLRPIELTEAQRQEMFNLTFQGVPIELILKKLEIGESQFWEYRKRYPLFEKEFKDIRAEAAEFIADRLLNITEGCETVPDMMRARVQSDNIRTVCGWRNPRVYGNRLDVSVQHTIDLSSVLAAADSRVIPILEARNMLPEPIPTASTLPRSCLKSNPEKSFLEVNDPNVALEASYEVLPLKSAEIATSEIGLTFEDLL